MRISMRFVLSAFVLMLAVPVFGGAEKAPFVKSYYLSVEPVAGDVVLFQCTERYHFASIWEIRDTTRLTYNTTLGFTTESSGYGPPEGERGWISGGNNDRWASCENWTTDAESMGTFSELVFWEIMDWGGNSNQGDGWFTEHHYCGDPIRVWCVSD